MISRAAETQYNFRNQIIQQGSISACVQSSLQALMARQLSKRVALKDETHCFEDLCRAANNRVKKIASFDRQ